MSHTRQHDTAHQLEALRDRLDRALQRAEDAEAERDALADTNRRNIGLLEVIEQQGVELEAAKQRLAVLEAPALNYNKTLARAEQAEAERDKWADAAASWELQAAGNRADAERLAEALKVSVSERDALRARWDALTAWATEQHRLSMGASRLVEVSEVVTKIAELEARDE